MSTLVNSRETVSPLRAGSLAGVIALHLAGFGLLALPQSFEFVAREVPKAAIEVEFVRVHQEPERRPVPPVPPPPQRPTPQPRTVAPQPLPVVVEPTSSIVIPTSLPPGDVETVGEPVDAGPVASTEATLAYDRAPPPPYPPMARKRGQQGEVLLRVQVDELGRPVAVEVERSSGHRMLDRAAREHVLARWRFHPATVGGEAVKAWARVPVAFRIQSL